MESFCLFLEKIIPRKTSRLNNAVVVREYGRQDKLSPYPINDNWRIKGQMTAPLAAYNIIEKSGG